MFIWDDTYSVGHEIIDQQHKKLFKLGAELEMLIVSYDNTQSLETVKTIYDALINYTRYHFDTEEDILRSIDYSQLEDHIKKHQSFIHRLDTFDILGIQKDHGAVLFDMFQLIANWIFEHIQGEDFRYKYELETFVPTTT